RAWREAVQNGVSQDEVDRVVAQYRTFFESTNAAADTTPSSQVIGNLLRSVDEKTVFTSPQNDLDLYNKAVATLTADKVNAPLRDFFKGDPQIFISSATPFPGGEAAIAAALADERKVPIGAPAAATAPPWPYTYFGKPGKVASQRTVDDL